MHPVPSLPDMCPGGSVKSSAGKLILVSDASATWCRGDSAPLPVKNLVMPKAGMLSAGS